MIFSNRYKRRANLRWPAMEFTQTHGLIWLEDLSREQKTQMELLWQ